MRLGADGKHRSRTRCEVCVEVAEPERQIGRGEHDDVAARELHPAPQRVAKPSGRSCGLHPHDRRIEYRSQRNAHGHGSVRRTVLYEQNLGTRMVTEAGDQPGHCVGEHSLLVVYRNHI